MLPKDPSPVKKEGILIYKNYTGAKHRWKFGHISTGRSMWDKPIQNKGDVQ